MHTMLKRILAILIAIPIIAVLLVAGSIVVDGGIGQGRVAEVTNTDITAPDGTTVRAYVARPDAPGTYPAVIMIHEFWGVREPIVGKAEALADEGYIVIAPDTYRGVATDWFPRAIYQSITVPQERVNTDLDGVYQWLIAQPDVQSDKIAIMGFCYGGGKALRYSLTNSELAATVVFYGSPITDTVTLEQLPAPVLGIFGTADQQIPVAEVNAFEQALDEAEIPNQVTLYEGQPHAFVKSIEEIRLGGVQGQAWTEFVAFLDETLKE
jgi:carboxymethylenebutenolidase